MSMIEEVMRRTAHERTAAMPGTVMSNSRSARQAMNPPPLPENFVPVQYRAAPVDPQAMERNRVLLRVPDVGISRAYKILRTRVLHRLAANNWFTLGITGTAAGEGKSLTAVNLALALAQLEEVRFAPHARLLALVKPTFELRHGGPIGDPSDIDKAVDVASAAASETGWRIEGKVASPALGRARAPEVFLYGTRS